MRLKRFDARAGAALGTMRARASVRRKRLRHFDAAHRSRTARHQAGQG
ncbi:hypothetical protein OH687_37895 [Burkholderia anthina]|nr:hypothetical protein OH687_37895 [Burkholderia anthina]